MNVLSLFSGIGGIDLGLERLGCTTVAHSEIDDYANQVFAKRFPGSVLLGDITQINWNEVASSYSIDIIAGGFPCQDISRLGKRAGIDGPQSGLWKHFADAIRILRPRGVLVENVPTLTKRGIDRVLGDLASCGYDAEWDCVPASTVGAPHKRDRIFILSYPNNYASEGRSGNRIEESWASPEETLSRRDCSGHGAERWKAEPGLDRLVDGVPDWVEWNRRVKVLGNAVVPQCAQYAGRILLDRIGE